MRAERHAPVAPPARRVGRTLRRRLRAGARAGSAARASRASSDFLRNESWQPRGERGEHLARVHRVEDAAFLSARPCACRPWRASASAPRRRRLEDRHERFDALAEHRHRLARARPSIGRRPLGAEVRAHAGQHERLDRRALVDAEVLRVVEAARGARRRTPPTGSTRRSCRAPGAPARRRPRPAVRSPSSTSTSPEPERLVLDHALGEPRHDARVVLLADRAAPHELAAERLLERAALREDRVAVAQVDRGADAGRADLDHLRRAPPLELDEELGERHARARARCPIRACWHSWIAIASFAASSGRGTRRRDGSSREATRRTPPPARRRRRARRAGGYGVSFSAAQTRDRIGVGAAAARAPPRPRRRAPRGAPSIAPSHARTVSPRPASDSTSPRSSAAELGDQRAPKCRARPPRPVLHSTLIGTSALQTGRSSAGAESGVRPTPGASNYGLRPSRRLRRVSRPDQPFPAICREAQPHVVRGPALLGVVELGPQSLADLLDGAGALAGASAARNGCAKVSSQPETSPGSGVGRGTSAIESHREAAALEQRARSPRASGRTTGRARSASTPRAASAAPIAARIARDAAARRPSRRRSGRPAAARAARAAIAPRGVLHPVQRGVAEDRVELAVEGQRLGRARRARRGRARARPRPARALASTPTTLAAEPRRASRSARRRRSRDRGCARPAAARAARRPARRARPRSARCARRRSGSQRCASAGADIGASS